jgi:hypothetical protein
LPLNLGAKAAQVTVRKRKYGPRILFLFEKRKKKIIKTNLRGGRVTFKKDLWDFGDGGLPRVYEIVTPLLLPLPPSPFCLPDGPPEQPLICHPTSSFLS